MATARGTHWQFVLVPLDAEADVPGHEVGVLLIVVVVVVVDLREVFQLSGLDQKHVSQTKKFKAFSVSFEKKNKFKDVEMF